MSGIKRKSGTRKTSTRKTSTRKTSTRKTSTRKTSTRKTSTSKTSSRKKSFKKSSFGSSATSGSHLAFGVFENFQFNPKTNSFGALEVPNGMTPVSNFKRSNNPLLIMPFGPGGQWLEKGHEGAASSGVAFGKRARFGNMSLEGKTVNPSGYLSTWNGQPRIAPPSWNPLLLQGNNVFREGINSPMLSNVVSNSSNANTSSFGRYHPIAPRTMPSLHSFGKGRAGGAMHSDKTKSKGWGKVARSLERKNLPRKCFVGKGMKYPVCDNDERYDCRGVLAAVQRSRKGTKTHKRAKALGKKLGCAWA